MKLTLASGSSSRGAQMGRSNVYPANVNTPIKLRMERLQWVDGDYDQWGAYWGQGNADVYCAWNLAQNVYIFVRGVNRDRAKIAVRESLPLAKFYR